ncbi:MAG: SpoIIE family protein phosphatase [Gammaproteobacteria bacterium]|nr:SpoIIE family protein phosphatase [Gammaproteobacteria bacterium]
MDTNISEYDVPVGVVISDQLFNTKRRFLRRTRFLQFASDEFIEELAQTVQAIDVPAGITVVEKGEQGDSLCFIAEGEVKVHDGNVEITRLSKGAMFGEIAALSPQKRTASITTVTASRLFVVKEKDFYRCLYAHPQAARWVIQGLCDHETRLVKEATEAAVKVKLLQRELELGQQIQKKFLPDEPLKIDSWQIESDFVPAHEAASDFYDYFRLETRNRIAAFIGDVGDSGVGAALFMSLFRSLLHFGCEFYDELNYSSKNTASLDQTLPSDKVLLLDIIHQINQYVVKTHAHNGKFTSLFFAVFDIESGAFVYVNAGHPAPLIRRFDGEVTILSTTSPVLGLYQQANYQIGKDCLDPGDVLFAYTDGLTQARNIRGEHFGHQQLPEIVRTAQNGATKVLHTVSTALDNFVQGWKQQDDLTLLAIGRWPGSGQTLATSDI